VGSSWVSQAQRAERLILRYGEGEGAVQKVKEVLEYRGDPPAGCEALFAFLTSFTT
jgi:hypothetical protein